VSTTASTGSGWATPPPGPAPVDGGYVLVRVALNDPVPLSVAELS
jgi:hypothetical protein